MVLVEKVFEPLDALLQAYKARLKPQETLEERARKYPDLVVEARQLEIYKQLIAAAQALEHQIKQTTSLVKTLNKETQQNETEPKSKMGQKNKSILCEPSLQELGLQGEKRQRLYPT